LILNCWALDSRLSDPEHGSLISQPKALVLSRKPARMQPCRPYALMEDVSRWLLPAVVLVLGVGWRAEAKASSLSVSPGFVANEHPHDCKCATKCHGGSCCCGSRGTAGPTKAPVTVNQPSLADAGPCVRSAPCGAPVLPTAPSLGSLAQSGALATRGRPIFDVAERLVASSPHRILPARRASRLHKPPE